MPVCDVSFCNVSFYVCKDIDKKMIGKCQMIMFFEQNQSRAFALRLLVLFNKGEYEKSLQMYFVK